MHDPESEIRHIPLSQLELSPDNVRKTPADDSAFTELKASIAAHGLLENLIARAMEPGADGIGRYSVIAGGRRLAAMQALAAEGALDEDHPVPCRMIGSIVAAEEVSLAENSVRAAMHPADQVEAFRRLADAGSTAAGAIECRYYGRDFIVEEMTLLRALIAADPQPTRAALSREFCRRIGWFKPDGGLKDMMARVTMLAMHRDGVIVLPPPKGRQYRPKPIAFGPDTEPPLFPPPTTLDELRPLEMRSVVRGTREGRLWNEFVARYHYLGYRTLVGAQMRYAVHDRDGWPVAMLGFSTAAWKLAPRDTFIGWTPQLREKNLPLMVDNPRFLILPWINIPNLGSHILAIIRRRLPEDWLSEPNDKRLPIDGPRKNLSALLLSFGTWARST